MQVPRFARRSLRSLPLLALGGAAGGPALDAAASKALRELQMATEDIAIGSPDLGYIDPELHSSTNQITFRDGWLGNGNAWVGALDPTTGTFVTDTGRDIWIDGQLPAVNDPDDNGPEWIRDNGVDKLLYTRQEGTQERLYMRAPGGGAREPIGPVDAVSRTHFAGTTGASGRAKILYRRWTPALQDWTVCWLDLNNPTAEFALPPVVLDVSLPTWVESRYILFSQQVGDVCQLATYDTATQSVTVQTTDTEDKLGGYAWRAPEAGGRLLYLTAIRSAGEQVPTAIRIYWREQPDDKTLTPFGTLTFPMQTGPAVVSSPEPFVFQNHSYISFALHAVNSVYSSIWVVGVPPTKNGPPFRPPQRVDDPTLKANKIDPESYVTNSRVFIYYYYRDMTSGTLRIHLHRCAFLAS